MLQGSFHSNHIEYRADLEVGLTISPWCSEAKEKFEGPEVRFIKDFNLKNKTSEISENDA